jgi:hypothetical protein
MISTIMARYYYGKKSPTDDYKKIESWWLKRHGYLDPSLWRKEGRIEWTYAIANTKHSVDIATRTKNDEGIAPYLEINYTQTEYGVGKKVFDYKIQMVSTPCQYGGVRWWFICPLVKGGIACGRRIGVLYKGGDYFGCRQCYNLTYNSRNRNHKDPVLRFLSCMEKRANVANTIKRFHYRGRLTRKYRHALNLDYQLGLLMTLIDKNG